MAARSDKLADLPSVDSVLAGSRGRSLLERWSRTALVEATRKVIEALRRVLLAQEELTDEELSADAVGLAAAALLESGERAAPAEMVNATGIILHTNLGRALLADEAAEAALRAATAPCALEYDLDSAGRGDRDSIVEQHLVALTGAEAATVVNNNAAAVLLTLASLAEGREVLVSRGELVEIGGSFRIPDVMAASGALMREVGTTNRTHLADYEQALGVNSAMLLKVHPSNYRVEGFTSAVSIAELAGLASARPGLHVVEDLGSGALLDLSRWGLPGEPLVADRLLAGADLVTFSGDKLLGGPQCGIVVGRRDLVEQLRRSPLKRALRCDKMTLAALDATLRIYRFKPQPEKLVPTLDFLSRDVQLLDELGARATELVAVWLGEDYNVELRPSRARVGSGAQPGVDIESRAVAVTSSCDSADGIARRFRELSRPVIGRIEGDVFLLDLAAVKDAESLVGEGSRAGGVSRTGGKPRSTGGK